MLSHSASFQGHDADKDYHAQDGLSTFPVLRRLTDTSTIIRPVYDSHATGLTPVSRDGTACELDKIILNPITAVPVPGYHFNMVKFAVLPPAD